VELSLDDATFSSPVAYTWNAGGYTFEVPVGDVERCIYARMTDRAGNASNDDQYDCITIDQTTPTGSFNIVSRNPLAADGYTDNRNVMINQIVVDADVVEVAFKHDDGSGEVPDASTSTGWMTLPLTTADSWDPSPASSFRTAGGVGSKTIWMRLKDDAGNTNAWGDISDVIYFDPNAPSAPVTLTVTPTNSCLVDWADDSDVQAWYIRYNFTGDYPQYDAGPPLGGGVYPVAATETTGFPSGVALMDGIEVTESEFLFGADTGYDLDHDAYCFTVWPLGKNGVLGAPDNATGTNYIMGDFSTYPNGDHAASEDGDGCLDFETEFFNGLGMAYDTQEGVDAGFEPLVDFTDHFGADPMGLPAPDDNVDLNDLIVFALNYATYNCMNEWDPYAKGAVSGPVAISAEMPRNVQAGSEFTVSFIAENTAGILGFHAVFDYNADVLEVVSVDQGQMYSSRDQFFSRSKKSDKIDVGGAVLGTSFSGDEMFTVTFKAKISGPVEIEDIVLEAIDAENNALDVSFDATKLVGELPNDFALGQNYPNPFNPTTTIDIYLPVASDYTLTIYNITGQVVTSFVGRADAGTQSIVWDAGENASGVYFYKLEAGTFTGLKKMVLLK
jgi:hypothetical protein